VANYVKLLLLENELSGVEYMEPYAGGANVALSLLFEDYASQIHINDLNEGVYRFWWAVLEHTQEFCRKIRSTRVTVEEWHRQRSVQTSIEADPFDLAFSTFFLNRTNRSGIISRGGVIGGLDQSGSWGLDARYNKDQLCARIEKIARFRTRITLTNWNAADLLRQAIDQGSPNSFIYLDPPYYVKGSRLYDNSYSHDDHVEVAELVHRLRCPWLVSYDAVPAIVRLYSNSPAISYSLAYSAARSYEGTELMFFSPDLLVPTEQSAAGIPSARVDLARAMLMLG
jgi:DNA adenine methylase